jgi:hypothetical protein
MLIFGTFQIGNAQNLFPDGDISLHHNVGCPRPTETLQNSDFWYSVGGTTVDYFLPECQYDRLSTDTWSFFAYPYYGEGFIGFWSVYRTNFTMGSETFATSLIEPLKANQPYFFSVDVRYRGKWHPDNNVFPLSCPTNRVHLKLSFLP